MKTDAQLYLKRNSMICLHVQPSNEIMASEFQNVKDHFYGNVFENLDNKIIDLSQQVVVYFCGDFCLLKGHEVFKNTTLKTPVRVIKELSFNYQGNDCIEISLGQVPLNVHNVGVFFREFFPLTKNFYDSLVTSHHFQSLTESNKTGSAYRTGIYLSKVTKKPTNKCVFNLLRCSTNFEGPTLNFCDVDDEIVSKVNEISRMHFDNPADCNHVLAQVYHNSTQNSDGKTKEKKARINSHSDKTKDMPSNGLIAFCTFYSSDLSAISKPSTKYLFDRVHKETSVLTHLRFKLKECVQDRPDLQKEFNVILYPNSLFIIPLSTNRLYTHATTPSHLPVDKIPTRLGYVIRCSNVTAVHRDGSTYILEEGHETKLEEPSDEDRQQLRDLYYRENVTADIIEYPNLRFSVNSGDYREPLYASA